MFGRPIDEKIAKLSLDNEQFERNAKNSIKTFNEMNKSFSKSGSVDLSGIENSVNSISNRFTMLGNLGQAAFQRVANSVLNLGAQLNNTFGLGGALAGFSEYELKLGSIQTIMVNTGESIGNVSSALDELNHYADQTVYSFSDMTKNIGLFTAAGVDLKTSVSSIKGLANLAAGMGVSNESAARATWQLSQALGSGKVRLQDWMSVENAGLGGQYFQKALVEHANKVGTLSMSYEQLTKKYGTFRDSLTKTGWLTTDVLTATLDDFANDKSLQSAATELKSFTQLVDTVKESVGSGWAQTWEILFGNLEEAKKFWTPIGTAITDFIGKSNDARNQFLKQWKDLGGLQSTFNGIGNILTGLGKILKIVGDGFRKLIPDITPQRAAEIAKSFEEITAKFAALDFSGFSEGVSNAFGLISKGLSGVVSALTSFSGLFNGIKTVVGTVFGFIGNAVGKLLSFASENLTFSNIFAGLAGGGILLAAKKIADVFNTISDALDKFLGGGEEKVSSIKDSVTSLLDGVGESLKAFTTGIKATTLLTIAAAVGILTLSISKLSTIKGPEAAASLGAIAVMLGELTAAFALIQLTLKKFKTKGLIKASIALIAIAAAVNILSDAIAKLAVIDPQRMAVGLAACAGGLAGLIVALKLLDKSKIKLTTAVAIIAIAEACKILAEAVQSFSSLSWDELARGLSGMGGALIEMVAAVAIMKKFGGFKSLVGSVAILLIAKSLADVASALRVVGSMSWESIGKGLTGIGGALAEISLVAGLLGKLGGISSLAGAGAIVLTVQSLDGISSALKSISSLSWEEIERGLAGMGGALAEIALAAGALGKLAGLSGLVGAKSIEITVRSLKPIADTLEQISYLSWEQIEIGLAGMGGALAEIGIVTGALGKLAGISGLIGAETIVIAVQSLKPIAEALDDIGSLSWEEIARGLVGMGGALTELAVISGATGYLAGFAGLVGAGTITLAAQGLDELSDAFLKFGSMDWDSIGRGLAAMGGAMLETAIGGLLNTFSGFGAGAIATMAPALSALADSMIKWKDVTVPSGLGPALSELAWGVMQFTLGGWGADTLTKIAEPIGTLGESFSKWKKVTVPKGIGEDLGRLADGVKAFTLGDWGANTLSTVAEPIGTLAESFSKWKDVKVPKNIGSDLQRLADGVGAFNFDGWGADTIKTVAEPIGTLAESFSKWKDVKVPKTIGDDLQRLADGVNAFNSGSSGAESVATVATPIGDLAGSISKWKDVTVPETIKEDLTNLASGVKSFTSSESGAESISTIAEPLGTLAGSVAQWKDVTVPETIEQDLISLANGVAGFALDSSVSETLNGIAEPLGTLAGSVGQWANVKLPEDLESNLKSLSSGVGSFNDSGSGAETISKIAEPIGTLANSLKNWSGLTLPENIKQMLSDLSDGLKKIKETFSEEWNAGSATSNISSLADAISKWNGIVIPEGLGDSLKDLAKGIKEFSEIEDDQFSSLDGLAPAIQKISEASSSIATIDFSGAVNAISQFISTLQQLPATVSSVGSGMAISMSVAVAGMTAALTGGLGVTTAISIAMLSSMFASMNMIILAQSGALSMTFMSSGSKWMRSLSQGIKNGQTIVSSAVKSVMTNAANSVRSNLSAFESVGRYAMNGLAAGIESNGSRAILAAARVARAALAAAKKELDINSPSRKFEEVGMYSDYGIANGFLRNVGVVTGAVKQTASKALNTMSDLMVGQSYNLSPSIVPVMDASRFNMIDDISDSIDFRAQLSDKTKIDSNSNQVMTNQLLQKLINKYDQLTDKLEDIKLYLHLEGIELDGEKVTDAVDEIHSIRDLLDKTGKGE